jgi:hypothetical protein
VSESEYEQFTDLCQRCGARNMSDFVRSAIDLMIRKDGSGFEREVSERLKQLETAVEQLRKSPPSRSAVETAS